MRLALLGDIHGNANALDAVLDEARRHGAQRIVCTGDIVGYFYEPQKCLELLAEWDVECVRGNHEDMLFHLIDDQSIGGEIQKRYGSGLAVATTVLSQEQLSHLDRLPPQRELEIDGATLLLCHGAPWDPAEYIYPDADPGVFARCASRGFDYVVLGHTHYQLAHRVGGSLIINPGSVGQPRGGARGVAHWAVLETETGQFEHRATEYDLSPVIAQSQQYDPDMRCTLSPPTARTPE